MRAWNTVVAVKNRDTVGDETKGNGDRDRKRGEGERWKFSETGNTSKTGGGGGGGGTVESVRLPGAHHFHT